MLIDVKTSFGGREGIQQFELDTMLKQLYRFPCSLAFVQCNQGGIDHVAANDQVLALCHHHEHLLPTGVIQPRNTLTWQQEVDRCLMEDVRLFRIYPNQGSSPWPVDSVFLERIVERLAGTGSALLVDATVPGLPSKVAEVTAEVGVPVIFSELRYFPLSEVLMLTEEYPHVYLETSRLTSPEAIEICVANVGANRILFGSGTARYPAWVAWQIVERADIPQTDRDSIYWRNAAKLLNVAPHSSERETLERETLEPMRQQPKSASIIDVHMHDKFPGTPIPPYTAKAYEQAMERQSVQWGICSSATGILYDIKEGNDEVAELLTSIPRLHGYVVVDPRYYEESIQELKRLESDSRFVGVKIHAAYSRTPTNSPEMRHLLQAVAPYRKPVLIHNLGSDWPEALVSIANDYPDLPIIAAHAGYGDSPHPTHDAALRVASAPNIYIEFCSTYLSTGAIRRGINAVGAERVLYGSDFPLIAQPYMTAAYEDAELTEEERNSVFYQNAWNLFFGNHQSNSNLRER